MCAICEVFAKNHHFKGILRLNLNIDVNSVGSH